MPCGFWWGPSGEHGFLSLQEADDLEQLCLDETGSSLSKQAGESWQGWTWGLVVTRGTQEVHRPLAKLAPMSWESGMYRTVPCSSLGVRYKGLYEPAGFWQVWPRRWSLKTSTLAHGLTHPPWHTSPPLSLLITRPSDGPSSGKSICFHYPLCEGKISLIREQRQNSVVEKSGPI